MKTLLSLALIIRNVAAAWLLLAASAQTVLAEKPPSPHPGRPAPEAIFEDLLQAPPGSPLDVAELRGKVVVLEFWATWCAPCIESIPHLNELANQFRDDVVFIAVTDEDRADVEPKLAELNMHSWIAFDTDRSVFENYDVSMWPYTVVIDANGLVAMRDGPFGLDPELLDRVIRGERASPGGSPPRQTAGKFDWESGVDLNAARAALSLSATNEPYWFLSEGGRVTGLHTPTPSLAMWSWDAAYSRLAFEGFDDPWETFYDAVIVVPDGDESDAKGAMRSLLRESLGLDIEWEEIETDVLVLSLIQGADHRLIEEPAELNEQTDVDTSTTHLGPGPKNYFWNHRHAKGQRIEQLREYLEQYTRRVVIDETGLEGFYSWSLELPLSDQHSPTARVEQALGLRLAPARRTARMLVIKPRALD